MTYDRFGFDFRIIHKNPNKDVIYDSGWTPNQVSNDGFEHIFDTFFRGATAPTSFKIGLLTANVTQASVYTDLVALAPTGTGYAEQALTRNNTGFPTLTLDPPSTGDMQITSAEVTFENTGGTNWTTVTHAYLASVTGASGVFISWETLSLSRTLGPGDTLGVVIRQKGRQSAE